MIEAITEGLSLLNSQSIYHGDIKPLNVFLDNSGKPKIADQGLISQYKDGYSKALDKEGISLLAPELIVELGKRNENPDIYDVYKCDIFSLGIMVLGLTTLQNPEAFYSIIDNRLRESDIHYALENIGMEYSLEFRNLLKSMLEFDPRRRISANSISKKSSVNEGIQLKHFFEGVGQNPTRLLVNGRVAGVHFHPRVLQQHFKPNFPLNQILKKQVDPPKPKETEELVKISRRAARGSEEILENKFKKTEI